MSSIPLSAPWFDEREAARLREALGGRIAGDGPFGVRVERRLAESLGAPRVLLTTSCTHALELALMALPLKEGDEVICPSFTFASTANAILRAGGRPVFADIEDRTLGLDPADVERRLSPRTRALLPVHYAGIAPDMDALLAIAGKARLYVVEDAAQAVGAGYRGRPLGMLGDAGAFSFHETKNITCGEGGALALRDPELIKRAEIIREKGTNRHAFLRGEVDKYTWLAEGSSFVLSDLLAALLDVQLDKAPEILARRIHVVDRYRAGLEPWARAQGVRLPPEYDDREGNGHAFYLLFPTTALRDRAMASVRARGVMATYHFVPLHSSPQGMSLGQDVQLPVTDRVASTLLRLPLHPALSTDDVDRVIDAVRHSL
jgi:dTDP-4-amino-4,6-dideoxygalactose transaminase